MRLLITGATGFVGSHLCAYLHALGYDDVWGTTTTIPSIEHQFLPEDRYRVVDLTQYRDLEYMLRELHPDAIIHLASIAVVGKSFEQAREILTNNIVLHLNLLQACEAALPNVRLLTIGSADSYGVVPPSQIPIVETQPFLPVNPYAVSKATQEMLSYVYSIGKKLDIVRVRPFNHTGERQTSAFFVPAMCEQIVKIERGEQDTLHVGSLSDVRDFSDVKDVVRAYELLLREGKTGEVYHVGSGVGHKMSEILDQLLALSNANIPIIRDEERLRATEIPTLIADISKIHREFGWQPQIPLDETLQRTLQWWQHL